MHHGDRQGSSRESEEEEVRYENLGPVLNEDGTPSELTKQMLAGTGRSLYPPFDHERLRPLGGDRFEHTIEHPQFDPEPDELLEQQYEDRYPDPEEE